MIDGPDGWFLLRVVVSTMIVIGSFVVLAWYLRLRVPMLAGERTGDHVRLLGSLAVGQGERVVLVRVSGCDYLLGVTAGSITVLERMPSADPDERLHEGPSDGRTMSGEGGST